MALVRGNCGIVEKTVYFGVWIGSILYSCISLLAISKKLRPLLNNEDFEEGRLLKEEKDVSDLEWEYWSKTVLRLTLPFTLHLLISFTMNHKSQEKIAIALRVFVTLACVCMIFGILASFFIILKCLTMFLISKTKCKSLIWFVCLSTLFIGRFETAKQFLFGNDDLAWYGFSVTYSWCNMRALSYGLDVSNGVNTSLFNFLKYFFYLPIFFCGPVITYESFQIGSNDPKKNQLQNIRWWNILQISRYVFWYIVSEAVLHYFYFNAIQQEAFLVGKLGRWELAGLGYAMGQFFQMKYVFFYGLCGEIARIDGVNAPPPPICIGRVHLYSHMWRYFDRGLHSILVKYIYVPIVKLNPSNFMKIAGSVLSFGYVFLWHGPYDFVLVWSILNCLGIIVEMIARKIGKTNSYKEFEMNLGYSHRRRFVVLLSVPLFAVSMVSNFYFFFGLKIGNIFAKRILFDFDIFRLLLRYLIFYCGCQVSMELSSIGTS
ncbi:protein-cysteine N-palmitoyltransferase Rasp-like [Artemia franciscana]|uniref:Protein-cysteine N-palmitoyltransferase Rasp n=2 Tax=Artemia franciscana TaxID=6661 RepID=A0AA88HE02_ARTSF|nr:hypothetical protein QYM36_015921 [Artemia franciscana]KAK2705711.1 hypothetical protein QYM36_015921 [Artemia franciscana]